VTRVLGLLLGGMAAMGVLLADRFGLLLVAWTALAVLAAGLTAAGRAAPVAHAARDALLAEILGVWGLGLGGLLLAGSAGAASGGAMPLTSSPPTVDATAHAWAGTGLLLAVAARLGLPPLTVWPATTAAARPAVRVFLHAGLLPLSALWLWQRLDAWLLPPHREVALWLGCVMALLLTAAALAARQPARRAGLVAAGRWAAVWAGAAAGDLHAWTPWLLTAGLVLLQLAVVSVRWPLVVRRVVLLAGILAMLPAGVPTGWLSGTRASFVTDPAVLLLHPATLLLLLLARHWWDDLAGATTPAVRSGRPARTAGGPGLLLGGARRATRPLAGAVSTTDRVVLGGVADGVGWIGLALGWLVAWSDRRGLDAAGHALGLLTTGAGRACRATAGGHPGRVAGWALVTVLVVTLMGRTLM
jgi:hypothetical protein